MRELNRVSRRTDAVVDRALVCDVRVVLFVEFLAVPAALEMDLGAHAVLAVGIMHIVFFHDISALIDAIEADTISDGSARVVFGAVGHCCVVVASCRFIAGQDHEAFREWYSLVDIRATAEVVHYRAVVVDFVKGSVRIFVV